MVWSGSLTLMDTPSDIDVIGSCGFAGVINPHVLEGPEQPCAGRHVEAHCEIGVERHVVRVKPWPG